VVRGDDGVFEGSDVLNAGIVGVHASKIGSVARYLKNTFRIMNSNVQVSMMPGIQSKKMLST
jgi:hypothetical protein